MEQQIAMPVMCNKCDELFDMTYDYKEELQIDVQKLGNLCWACRIA